MQKKGQISKDYYSKLKGATYVFGGINNVLDPYNINIESGQLPSAINVDIDNTMSISRRSGYDEHTTLAYGHSGWANTKYAFYVDSGYLKLFTSTGTKIVDIVDPLLKMYYCDVNDVVMYSNGKEFGFYPQEVENIKSIYSEFFKVYGEIGTHLEFFNGRVYWAKENTVYCSDPFNASYSDSRFNVVVVMPTKVTMIKRVTDGLYIGTEDRIIFLQGKDIQEGGFDYIKIEDYGVVNGTDLHSFGEYFPLTKATGPIVIFTSKRGICTGSTGGNFINHSLWNLSIPESSEGSAYIIDKNGYRQYIVSLNNGVDYNTYPTPTFEINTL